LVLAAGLGRWSPLDERRRGEDPARAGRGEGKEVDALSGEGRRPLRRS